MEQSQSAENESPGEHPASRFRLPTPALVLASASPRRHELLGQLGATFRIIATDAEEQDHLPPQGIEAQLPACPVPLATHPTLLAWRKADAACAEAPDSVIIGADTIVVLGGDVLGKPRDPGHARAMLRRLSGHLHTVYTGLAVLWRELGAGSWEPGKHQASPPTTQLLLALVASDVLIADLTDAEIADYVATGEPLDKAGAYGIQGLGGRLVSEVRGSYTCVVGLPLVETHHLLSAAGIAGLNDPSDTYLRWLQAQGKEPLPCPPTFP